MVLLQPLPAFLWLGLTEQATPADAKAAFRRLSKRQHPDAGGDAAQWQVTLECRELLKDSERLEYRTRRRASSFRTHTRVHTRASLTDPARPLSRNRHPRSCASPGCIR